MALGLAPIIVVTGAIWNAVAFLGMGVTDWAGGSGEPLETYFQQAILTKPEHHAMPVAMPADARRTMSQIGG